MRLHEKGMNMGIRTFGMAALLVTSAFVSVAPGGAPMGLPAGYLGEGQWGIGAEYGYGQTDLKASGTVADGITGTPLPYDFKLDQFKSNMAFGTIGYGIVEGWDIFARLGASDAKGDIGVVYGAPTHAVERQGPFSGSFGFAYGGGTRVTFYDVKPLTVGGLIQGTWFQTSANNFHVTDPHEPDETWTGKAKLDYWQIQASVAAALQVEKWRFWAGPFVQYTQGTLDVDGRATLDVLNGALTWSSSLHDPWQVGGHFGANWDVCDQFHLWVEGQVTAESWLVGIGAVIIPQKAFGI
jgi:hypothetical protein